MIHPIRLGLPNLVVENHLLSNSSATTRLVRGGRSVAMNASICAAQCQIEREILQHIKAALRITLRWEVDQVGLDHKLSSVRFTAQSFRRHLQRIMALEEDGGYLLPVDECKPNLVERARSLQGEHGDFRETVERVIPTMERLSPDDRDEFEHECHELSVLLDRVDRHDQREMDLLQEVLCRDEGGEG
jgi:hypothetical protein